MRIAELGCLAETGSKARTSLRAGDQILAESDGDGRVYTRISFVRGSSCLFFDRYDEEGRLEGWSSSVTVPFSLDDIEYIVNLIAGIEGLKVASNQYETSDKICFVLE